MEYDIENKFRYHEPKGDQPQKYAMLRNMGRELAELVNNMVPDSREKSLAMTKIEEAIMWANAGIARSGE